MTEHTEQAERTEQGEGTRGSTEPLSDAVVRQELQGLPNWLHDDEANTLVREYRFEDAGDADRFLSQLDELGTDFGYRPVTERNGAEVKLALSTDSAVSYRDLEFARRISQLPERNL